MHDGYTLTFSMSRQAMVGLQRGLPSFGNRWWEQAEDNWWMEEESRGLIAAQAWGTKKEYAEDRP